MSKSLATLLMYPYFNSTYLVRMHFSLDIALGNAMMIEDGNVVGHGDLAKLHFSQVI